jgi:hypothetical protein
VFRPFCIYSKSITESGKREKKREIVRKSGEKKKKNQEERYGRDSSRSRLRKQQMKCREISCHPQQSPRVLEKPSSSKESASNFQQQQQQHSSTHLPLYINSASIWEVFMMIAYKKKAPWARTHLGQQRTTRMLFERAVGSRLDRQARLG